MDILILLGSQSDLKITDKGLGYLKELGISFELRVASAHRTPEMVHKLIHDFDEQGGKAIICVAGKSAHLAGVAAAATLTPVIAVPVFNPSTAGFDALLSMGQMPAGIPVATMGLGGSGFANGCLYAVHSMSVFDASIKEKLGNFRRKMAQDVIQSDKDNQIIFNPKK